MTVAAFLGQLPTIIRQKHSAIRTLRDEAFLNEPFQHFDNCWLGYAEVGGDVDLARLAAFVDKVRDQFDIIFNELGAAGLPRLMKADRLFFRNGEFRLLLAVFWAGARWSGQVSCPLSHISQL